MTSLTILNTVLAQTVQAVSDTIAAANNVVAASGQQIEQTTNELSVWSLCLKGGFIMIPLAVLALLSIYVLVERYLAIKAAAKEDDTFMKRMPTHCNPICPTNRKGHIPHRPTNHRRASCNRKCGQP